MKEKSSAGNDKVVDGSPVFLITFSELKRKTRLIIWNQLTRREIVKQGWSQSKPFQDIPRSRPQCNACSDFCQFGRCFININLDSISQINRWLDATEGNGQGQTADASSYDGHTKGHLELILSRTWASDYCSDGIIPIVRWHLFVLSVTLSNQTSHWRTRLFHHLIPMSDDNDNTTGGGRSLGGGAAEPLPSSWSRPSERPRVGRIGNWSGASSGSSASRFGSIAGLGGDGGNGGIGGPHDHDDEDEDENKEGESWFAGGERSGLSIENPDRQRRVPGGNMVRDLLRRAAQAGPPPAAPPRSSSAFAGGGHTLGSDEVESSYIPDTMTEEETIIRHLTIWRNGFQVENGELMRYDDPAHAGVLEAINAGHAPPSIMNAGPNQHVELRVAERITEDYVPPKGTRVFAGSGHRLGAIVPDFGSSAESSSALMPGTFPVSGATLARSTPQSSNVDRDSILTRFEVDQSLPTTSVQIRLADGTRMVCRMNLTHTVLDIRNFINASRPENVTRPYTIGTTFPNRVLDDDTATIEGAGLINSVVVQRWV